MTQRVNVIYQHPFPSKIQGQGPRFDPSLGYLEQPRHLPVVVAENTDPIHLKILKRFQGKRGTIISHMNNSIYLLFVENTDRPFDEGQPIMGV